MNVPMAVLAVATAVAAWTGWPVGDGTDRPTRHEIEIRDFAFAPVRLEVAVGDTVVWRNRDAAPHTATEVGGRWDSGHLRAGAEWTWIPAEAGSVFYDCEYHPAMRGTLVVRGSTESDRAPENRP